jgi:hypothetical protein
VNRVRQFFSQAMGRLKLVPPRKHRFEQATELYLAHWGKASKTSPANAAGGGIGVVITPWMQTPVPFYSLECAREFARSGRPVTIIWDSTDTFGNASNAWEVGQIERVIAAARREFPVVSPPPTGTGAGTEPNFLTELISENAVQKVRGEFGAEEYLAAHPELEAAMRQHAVRVRTLLEEGKFEWLLLPGGVWATSGIYAGVAADLGLSITTYDSGPGAIFLGHDGVAAHFCDITAVFQQVAAETRQDPGERHRMAEVARCQMEVRMGGNDAYRLQPIAASSGNVHTWDVIVPLNLRWDSSALCRKQLFKDVTDWLSQLLTWAEAHPAVRVAIRQHPCEKLVDFRGTDDFSKLVERHPSLAGRVQFISAHEQVNTYDMIAGAKVVLPFTSRVGIEAAILGKPVILAAKCFYGGCEFTTNPASAAEYFDALEQAIDGQLPVSEEARQMAFLAYYLTECCLELKTNFSPAPSDFAQWVSQSLAEIWAREENQDLLDAMLTREPLASIRYRRLASAAKNKMEAATR